MSIFTRKPLRSGELWEWHRVAMAVLLPADEMLDALDAGAFSRFTLWGCPEHPKAHFLALAEGVPSSSAAGLPELAAAMGEGGPVVLEWTRMSRAEIEEFLP